LGEFSHKLITLLLSAARSRFQEKTAPAEMGLNLRA
jgi:hypothetical protein